MDKRKRGMLIAIVVVVVVIIGGVSMMFLNQRSDNMSPEEAEALILEHVRYTLEDGQVTLDGVKDSYKKDKIVIPEKYGEYPIVHIGKNFAYNMNNIKEIVLPDTIQTIGASAFAENKHVQSIRLPAGLTSISDGMFSKCSSLATISIPDGVTTIGSSALYGCSALKEITIPDAVTEIGANAFTKCTSLQIIYIPGNIKSLKATTFSSCDKLEAIFLAEGIEALEAGTTSVFSGFNKLKELWLPPALREIGDFAIGSCEVEKIYMEKGSYAETWANQNGYTLNIVYVEDYEKALQESYVNYFGDN